MINFSNQNNLIIFLIILCFLLIGTVIYINYNFKLNNELEEIKIIKNNDSIINKLVSIYDVIIDNHNNNPSKCLCSDHKYKTTQYKNSNNYLEYQTNNLPEYSGYNRLNQLTYQNKQEKNLTEKDTKLKVDNQDLLLINKILEDEKQQHKDNPVETLIRQNLNNPKLTNQSVPMACNSNGLSDPTIYKYSLF